MRGAAAVACIMTMAAAATKAWSLPRSLGEGAWRFTVVSLAGFSPWACAGGWLHARLGEGGLYAVSTLAFLAAAALLLPPVLPPPHRQRRLLRFFVPAFVVYAVVWCGCWFALGAGRGEWLGAALGGAMFVLITGTLLGRPASWSLAVIVFVLAHAAGYAVGGQAMHLLAGGGRPGSLAMLAWGGCYGLGFGAGLGYLIHACLCSGTAVTEHPPDDTGPPSTIAEES